jgi:hypothetical protein
VKGLNVSHEQTLLSFGDAKHTPRRRALALGLTLDDYLAAVYPSRAPGPLAAWPPTGIRLRIARLWASRLPDAAEREARARRVIALLREGELSQGQIAARVAGIGRTMVAMIASRKAWAYLWDEDEGRAAA